VTGKVPKPTGTYSQHHHLGTAPVHGSVVANPGHSDPRPAGLPKASLQQQVAFQPPPSRGINVRYFYNWKGEPNCEVWNQGRRVDPPPYLVSRADKTKKDCIFRVGDSISGGSVEQSYLPLMGFDDPGTSALTALLFFLMDTGADDDYKMLCTIHQIIPNRSNQWKGTVVFRRSLVVGGTVLPVPRQSGSEEDFQISLIWYREADELMQLAKVIEVFEEVLMDLVWALTGGFEVKAAEEVTEKYVAREVLRQGLKYLKPKFVAIAKAYIIAFVKAMAVQAFHRLVFMMRMGASDKLMQTVGGGAGPITVDQIHWLQSANKLSQAADEASAIHWKECHEEAMKEALTPFWKVFGGSRVANGPLRRFLTKCLGYIETFFFDIGLGSVIKKAESTIAKKINKTIIDATTFWMADAEKSGKPVDEKAAEEQIRIRTMSNLTDGTLVEMVKKYFEDNWEKMAKGALDKVQDDFVKAIRGGKGEE
jgi:hypothetical protein